jgi:hypothetical protein
MLPLAGAALSFVMLSLRASTLLKGHENKLLERLSKIRIRIQGKAGSDEKAEQPGRL